MNFFARDKTFCSWQIFFFMTNLLCLLRSGLYSVSGLVGSRVTLAKILSKIRVSTARSAVFNKPHDLKIKNSKRSVPYPTPLQFFSSQWGLSEAYSNAMSKEEKRYYFYFQPKCKTLFYPNESQPLEYDMAVLQRQFWIGHTYQNDWTEGWTLFSCLL